ncbi:hypothetical protein [Streptomyces sp. SID5473]|nr:hypothetical protein [Streptomyces sp. SID5473]
MRDLHPVRAERQQPGTGEGGDDVLRTVRIGQQEAQPVVADA